MRIERAILSVSDKTGIVELARALAEQKVEILSTGGTAKHLQAAGIPVTPITAFSGAPEMLGGRVKTLTPRVFGAILHDRADPDHLADVALHSIPRIDLVVVNLYPFETTVAREGVRLAEAVEQIDIGGPSMLRAAAKNHRHVLPLCDPSMYPEFISHLARGEVEDDFRLRCALAVFERTAAYDAAIAAFLRRQQTARSEQLPESLSLTLQKFQDLRYGENPQQLGAFYVRRGVTPFHQIQGKELSYNNLLDLDAALHLAFAFREPAAAVIKHTNPCGTARAANAAEALRLAIEADPVSAFGGIVGLNRPFDEACAQQVESLFLEVIVAPSFTKEAQAALEKKKNLRLVTSLAATAELQLRSAAGGILVQSPDRIGTRESWRVATKIAPTNADLDALEFAWIVSAHVKSNAIVLTRPSQSAGVGAGQMSRVDAARLAVSKAGDARGTYAASDAFFPFRDGLDILADAGVRAVIQPGGSVRDQEVIAAADERGLAMVLTGERHFRH